MTEQNAVPRAEDQPQTPTSLELPETEVIEVRSPEVPSRSLDLPPMGDQQASPKQPDYREYGYGATSQPYSAQSGPGSPRPEPQPGPWGVPYSQPSAPFVAPVPQPGVSPVAAQQPPVSGQPGQGQHTYAQPPGYPQSGFTQPGYLQPPGYAQPVNPAQYGQPHFGYPPQYETYNAAPIQQYAGQPGFGASYPYSDADRSSASMAHWLAILISWIGPLIIMNTVEARNPWVRKHAVNSLNFEFAIIVGVVLSIPLMFVLIGFLTLPALAVADLVYRIKAAGAASRGEDFKYPFSINLVR